MKEYLMPYRTGSHWGTTIVWEGGGQPDPSGRTGELVAWTGNGPKANEMAQRITRLLNEDQALCVPAPSEQERESAFSSLREDLEASAWGRFMDDLKAGRTTPANIDGYISYWSELDSPRMPLHEFLGMTYSDFAHWAATGTILGYSKEAK